MLSYDCSVGLMSENVRQSFLYIERMNVKLYLNELQKDCDCLYTKKVTLNLL